MRFVCEGRAYDTDEFDRVYTGNTRVPLVLISRDGREVLFVEQGRPEPALFTPPAREKPPCGLIAFAKNS